MRRDHLWDSPHGDLAPLADYWRLGPYLMAGAQIAAERYAAQHPREEPKGAAKP